MDPIAFQIGSLTIRWYGAMAALGFISALFLLEFNRRFAKLSKDNCSTLLFLAMVAGVIGARIFYVVQFFHQYRNNLWDIIRIDQGGLVFYGGFLLALFCVIIYSRIKKLDVIRVLDVFVPSLTAAHGLGRIGCFFAGCCYGKETTGLGVVFPEGSLAPAGVKLIPTQLISSFGDFVLFYILYIPFELRIR